MLTVLKRVTREFNFKEIFWWWITTCSKKKTSVKCENKQKIEILEFLQISEEKSKSNGKLSKQGTESYHTPPFNARYIILHQIKKQNMLKCNEMCW